MDDSNKLSRNKAPNRGAASLAGDVKAGDHYGKGRMSIIRVFVVLSWVFFALRQIFMKPVKVLAGRDSQSR